MVQNDSNLNVPVVLHSTRSMAESGTQMNGIDAYPRFEKDKESEHCEMSQYVSICHKMLRCQCWHSGDRCDGEFFAGPGEKAM